MNRLDYMTARLGQLRHRGASQSWAMWLTRLELGERPAGQMPVHSIRQGLLFRMVRADMLRPSRVRWRSPQPISEEAGFALAILLRVLTTGREASYRSAADGVSVLTLANIDAVTPVFSYFASPLNLNRPPKLRAFEWWILRHSEELPRAREQLLRYVDRENVAGFAAYDG